MDTTTAVLCQRASSTSMICSTRLKFTGRESPADFEHKNAKESVLITPVAALHIWQCCALQSMNSSQVSCATTRDTQFRIHKWHIATGHCIRIFSILLWLVGVDRPPICQSVLTSQWTSNNVILRSFQPPRFDCMAPAAHHDLFPPHCQLLVFVWPKSAFAADIASHVHWMVMLG